MTNRLARNPNDVIDLRGPKENLAQKERQPYFTTIESKNAELQIGATDLGALDFVSADDPTTEDNISYADWKKQQAELKRKKEEDEAAAKAEKEELEALPELTLEQLIAQLNVGSQVKCHYLRPGGIFSENPEWGKIMKIGDGTVDVRFKNSLRGLKRDLPTAAIREVALPNATGASTVTIKPAATKPTPKPVPPQAARSPPAAGDPASSPEPKSEQKSEPKPDVEPDRARVNAPKAFVEAKKKSKQKMIRRRKKPQFDADGKMIDSGDKYNAAPRPPHAYDHKGRGYSYDVFQTSFHGWNRDGTNINYKDRRCINFKEKSKVPKPEHLVPRTNAAFGTKYGGNEGPLT